MGPFGKVRIDMLTNKDRQFMYMCINNAKILSTCSRRQYCAIIVNDSNHIIGTGYNGPPPGFTHCIDGGCPRGSSSSSKHGIDYSNCYAVHAEANALLHSDYSAYSQQGTRIYVNGPPCFDCAKLIANSGIKKVFYIPDDNYEQWNNVKAFLELADIEVISAEKD